MAVWDSVTGYCDRIRGKVNLTFWRMKDKVSRRSARSRYLPI